MKVKELKNFESVKRMLGELNLLTRSENTQLTYLKGLNVFFRLNGIENPDQFIEKVKQEKNQNQIYKNFILALAERKLAPKTVVAWGSALKKFLAANDLKVTEEVSVKIYNVHEDKLPTKEELKKALELSDLKAKVAILLLASSGMRVGELHQLKIGDIDFEKDPPTVRISGQKAKERKSRITFISKEVTEVLKDYIEKRKAIGHQITADSPVIARDDGKPMSYQNMQYLLKNVFKKISKKEGGRYKLHAHCLRKWFKTQMISAGVPAPIVDRLMGHSRYLAKEYELYTEEQLRDWYKKGMPSLRITG